jgi:hypothetical protein
VPRGCGACDRGPPSRRREHERELLADVTEGLWVFFRETIIAEGLLSLRRGASDPCGELRERPALSLLRGRREQCLAVAVLVTADLAPARARTRAACDRGLARRARTRAVPRGDRT